MSGRWLSRVTGVAMIAFALIALVTVTIGVLQVLSGAISAPEPDEGTGAHIFQLSVDLAALFGLAYIVSADWRTAWLSARPIVIAGALLLVAFAGLYYMEHVHVF